MAGQDKSRETLKGVRNGELLPPAPSHSLFKSQTVFAACLEPTTELSGPPPAIADLTGPQAGDLIAGRYRVIRPLGRGGMGRILEVKHERLGNTFALKCMNEDLLSDEQARRSFYREARFASSLSNPRIPAIVDYGEDPGVGSFMVMEYVEGENLHSIIRRSGPLKLEVALSLTREVASALDYVHRQQLVHGDVKADNVIVPPEGQGDGRSAKVVDFGLARTKATGDGPIQGTLAYIAPERVRREPATPLSDTYSFGVLLYYVLSGRFPFTGDAAEILQGHLIRDPEPLPAEVPAAIQQLVERCMAKNPADRPANMAAVVGELRRERRSLGASASRRISTVQPDALDSLVMPTYASFLLPIGVVSADGEIVTGNVAFERLVFGISKDPAGHHLDDTPLAQLWPTIEEDVSSAAGGELVRRVITDPTSSESYLVWLEPSPTTGYVTVGAHPIVHFSP
ncbi:MAG: serine/threonine protein kinase [Deltaproteobacteria bacterium]|nr:serine/threonine protein kinase [Deltaproteobacteria bacterium]